MSSCLPDSSSETREAASRPAGSWDDLLWRLRAETAAANAGDWSAVRALASGALLSGPPPDAKTAYEALHLQRRLEAQLSKRAERMARMLEMLQAAAAQRTSPGKRLDARR